jgi:hypothetical protein
MTRLMAVLCLVVGLGAFVPVEALAVEKAEKAEKKKASKSAPEGDDIRDEEPASDNPFVTGQPGGIYDTAPQERSAKLSLFLIIPWWYGFGIGAGGRYELPLVPEGFVPTLNDSFELEFGGDVWYGSWSYLGGGYSYTGLGIPVEGRWTFHFSPKLAAYAKLGLGWYFHFWSGDVNGSAFSGSGLYWNTATGAIYQISDSFWLRGELGYTGLKMGVSLKF